MIKDLILVLILTFFWSFVFFGIGLLKQDISCNVYDSGHCNCFGSNEIVYCEVVDPLQ